MAIPQHKISYAEHFADLVLAGMLKSVQPGFYVDVGAGDPELASVTRIFYDRGWSGINIESRAAPYAMLRAQRVRDITVQARVSSQPGWFASAATPEAVASESRLHDGASSVTTLADLLVQHRPHGELHFMRVNTGGRELEAVLGNDWQRFRPWVLCLARGVDPARHAALLALLAAQGYPPVFFDGIDDFFVANERIDLWHGFSYRRDVLSGGVPVSHLFVRALAELEAAAAAGPDLTKQTG